MIKDFNEVIKSRRSVRVFLKENINTIGETEIDEIINDSLKKNDNFRWQRFKHYRLGIPEDVIVKAKEEFEKILLCDVQIKIYPDIEKSFLNLLHNSGYTGFQLENKIDFQELYNNRFN